MQWSWKQQQRQTRRGYFTCMQAADPLTITSWLLTFCLLVMCMMRGYEAGFSTKICRPRTSSKVTEWERLSRTTSILKGQLRHRTEKPPQPPPLLEATKFRTQQLANKWAVTTNLLKAWELLQLAWKGQCFWVCHSYLLWEKACTNVRTYSLDSGGDKYPQ